MSTVHTHDAAGHHADEHHDHGPAKGWRRWLFATNHKDIGTMYLVFSLIMFFIGGAMAMVIRLELFKSKAPVSVDNFLQYVKDGHYNGTVFHRVIKDFMIQGGGFDKDMRQKPTHGQIKNESTNGLKNDIGTVAMARTSVRDSATSQFFINTKNNDFLNYSGESPQGYGYAVFGKVVSGMDVVMKIGSTPTGSGDVPKSQVVIESISLVK